MDKIQNYAIHASIRHELWNIFVNVIMEGNIYDISQFSTIVARGKVRPLRSHMCITFTNRTLVDQVMEDDMRILFHKFDFSEIGDLGDIVDSYPEDKSPDYNLRNYFNVYKNMTKRMTFYDI